MSRPPTTPVSGVSVFGDESRRVRSVGVGVTDYAATVGPVGINKVFEWVAPICDSRGSITTDLIDMFGTS
jgi:hypothetical protein